MDKLLKYVNAEQVSFFDILSDEWETLQNVQSYSLHFVIKQFRSQ